MIEQDMQLYGKGRGLRQGGGGLRNGGGGVWVGTGGGGGGGKVEERGGVGGGGSHLEQSTRGCSVLGFLYTLPPVFIFMQCICLRPRCSLCLLTLCHPSTLLDTAKSTGSLAIHCNVLTYLSCVLDLCG